MIIQTQAELNALCEGCVELELQDRVHDWVQQKLGNGQRVSGFGHPVYSEDPRPQQIEDLGIVGEATRIIGHRYIRKTENGL